ncbi:MAG: universal stress protein [Chthoniobacterales bacterium]
MKATSLRQILVPIDFSPASLASLRFAKLLAARFGAKLHLVHVIAPAPIYGLGRGVLLLPFPDKAMVQAARQRLQDLISQLSLPPRSTQCTLRVGQASTQINEAAEKHRSDLIAIATGGTTRLKRALLGSTTERVVRQAPCPVLVVREGKHQSTRKSARKGRTALKFRKILVPIDFPECSRLGLEYALGFAREFRAGLVLFHSIFVHAYMLGDQHAAREVPGLNATRRDRAKDKMEALQRSLSRKGREVESEIAFGSPLKRINDYAVKEDIDLIITSTHGRTGLRRVFASSTAERIVRDGTCPVLVVPNRPARKKDKRKLSI